MARQKPENAPVPSMGKEWQYVDGELGSLVEEMGRMFASHAEESINKSWDDDETLDKADLVKTSRLRLDSLGDWLNAAVWLLETHGGEIEPGRYETVGVGAPEVYGSHLIEFIARNRGYDTRTERITDENEEFDLVVVVEGVGEGHGDDE